MVKVIAYLGPDDLETWCEILIEEDALKVANPAPLADARTAAQRRMKFMIRVYAAHELEPTHQYEFCPFSGAIIEVD